MRAIGFNAGQFGDVIMGTVAARAHKEQYPDSHLTLGVAQKYSGLNKCFQGPYLAEKCLFDDVHVWKGYNDWPTSDDSLYLATTRYDKVYQPMPQHTDPFWYLRRHQTAELCLMHGLTPPSNLQVHLPDWKGERTVNRGVIALSLFGETRGGEKSISVEKGKAIANLVSKMGYHPFQLGLPSEPQICEHRLDSDFFGSVLGLRNCVALITIDTAMAWIASGYSMPTIGLYGYEYYSMAQTSKNWQPINPNAIYLESAKAGDIILDRIEAAIKTLNPCKS